jgi:glyoxylase-like metal-dependent hydrolase (beta-lactamase superfamily II)
MVERIVVGSMYTNAYIFSAWKKECLIIDPGADPEKIISHLVIKNLKPRGIILTHGHLDHIAGCLALKEYFEKDGAKVELFIHEADSFYMGSAAENVHKKSFASLGLIDDSFWKKHYAPTPEPDVLLKDGDTIYDSDLVVIHTPGHTQGSICLYSSSQQFIFSGDTLFFEGIGRTDLSGGDSKAIIESINRLFSMLPDNVKVMPGHGPFSSIEREKKHNPFLK